MTELIVVLCCLGLNAFFAAYEMAFVSVPKSELRALSRKGNRQAQKLVKLRDHPERTLSIIQIGITLVGAVAAAVGGAGASDSIEPYLIETLGMREGLAEVIAVTLIVLPLSYVNVVIGELVPKSLALRRPLKIVFAGAPVLFFADRFLSPVVSLLEASTKFLLHVFFPAPKVDEAASSTTVEIDALSPLHQRFVLNMVDIENKKVRDMMVAWAEVNHVRPLDTIEDVTHVVLSSGHTRLPVCDGEQVTGILHTKEFMSLRESGDREWTKLVRPTLQVRPGDSAFGLLRLMQERRSHLAVVIDTKILGIVTLEDIVEEVVGDIYDEDDDGTIRRLFLKRSKDRRRLV